MNEKGLQRSNPDHLSDEEFERLLQELKFDPKPEVDGLFDDATARRRLDDMRKLTKEGNRDRLRQLFEVTLGTSNESQWEEKLNHKVDSTLVPFMSHMEVSPYDQDISRLLLDEDMDELLREATLDDLEDLAEALDDPEANNGHTELLSSVCFVLYTRTGLFRFLENATSAILSVADGSTTSGSPRLAARYNNVATMLTRRAIAIDEPGDLDEGIIWAEKALDCASDTDQNRPALLGNLANKLMRRYDKTGELRDIYGALYRMSQADLIRTVDRNNAVYAKAGIVMQMKLFERRQDPTDLSMALDLARELVRTLNKDNPDRLEVLSPFIAVLGKSKNPEHWRITIELSKTAMKIYPHSQSMSMKLERQRNELESKFVETRSLEDLDQAIELTKKIIGLAFGSVSRGLKQIDLSALWMQRYETSSKDEGSLRKAIEAADESLANIPTFHPHRHTALAVASSAFLARHELHHEPQDLESALARAEEAVSCSKSPETMGTLGHVLSAMYGESKSLADLDRAIFWSEEALKSYPKDRDGYHLSNKGVLMMNLFGMLQTRYKRTRAPEDREEAAALAQMTAETFSTNSALSVRFKTRLAINQSVDFDPVTASPMALHQHMVGMSKLLDELPPSSPDRVHLLSTLASNLERSYSRAQGPSAGNPWCLETAADLVREALRSVPLDSPTAARYFLQLGNILRKIYKAQHLHNHQCDEFKGSITAYLASWGRENADVFVRLRAGRKLVRVLGEMGNWFGARKILREAVMLIPRICPRSLPRRDQQYTVSQVHGLAAEAASAVLQEDGQKAAEALGVLELGRGVIFGYGVERRGANLSLPQNKNRALFAKFLDLRDQLDRQTANQDADLAEMSEYARGRKNRKHSKMVAEFEQTLEDIRKSDKALENFLNFPPEDELKELAGAGPIVVFNSTKTRSDAIIVTTEKIWSIHLEGLEYGELRQNMSAISRISATARNREMKDPEQDVGSVTPAENAKQVLAWLWDVAVKPVLEGLAMIRPDRGSTVSPDALPRIWWMGTGLMSLAPIHAAGYHDGETQDGTLHHVVSSYTSTLRALKYAREKPKPPPSKSARMLVVAMPDTGGQDSLNVAPEVDAVRSVFGGLAVELPRPTKREVLNELPHYSFVHFACHGRCSRRDPSESGLLLMGEGQSGLLRVSELDSINLDQAEAAYLSACSTAAISTERLLDEAITLANSIQLIGFRSVVGTLWAVNDAAAAEIATEFYTNLRTGLTDADSIDSSGIAVALHNAITTFRSREKGESGVLLWAPFVHIGV
jgi:tetratricopeptide (TPR) repeat protein